MSAWPGSRAAVERAARLAGPDARVAAARALPGGTHARPTLIRTANPEREVVLREFPAGDDARVLSHCDQEATQPAEPSPLLGDLWSVARSHDMVETWVPNYRDLGRADLTATELRSRHSAWMERLLAERGVHPG